MSQRMAGAALMGLLGGGAGAVISDSLAHDDMDHVAQGYKNWSDKLGQMPEEVKATYSQIFGSGPMSNMDRIVTSMILEGKADPVPPGQEAADTKAGKQAVKLASELRLQSPPVGELIGALAKEEQQLFFKESQMGVSSQDVVAEAQAGAGVNPVVPLLAALAGGVGGAALGAAAGKRGFPR